MRTCPVFLYTGVRLPHLIASKDMIVPLGFFGNENHVQIMDVVLMFLE